MKLSKIFRRFLVPSFVVTAYCLLKYKCKISPKAEVELNEYLHIGSGTVVSSFVKIKPNGPLQIGENVSIGACSFLSADAGGVKIGDYCMIGPNASIIGNNYQYDQLDVPLCQQKKTSKGIHIGDNVWIASGCVILDGATIGNGAIITPNSVVSGKIPDNSIAQGNPAKVIFTRR